MSLLTEFFSDENNRNAMVLSLISGLSTGLGGVFIALFGSPSKRTTGFMLAFASGVMIYVSVFDLLPESYEKIGIQPLIISVCYPFITKSYDLFFIVGGIIMHLIVKFIPEPNPAIMGNLGTDPKLLVTSLVVITGISLHNFPEGMAVYLSTINGWHLGVTIAIAIGLHNLPEGLAVAAPIYAATKSRYQAIKWSLISGLCEPAGALAFGLFFRRYIESYGVSCMLAGVAAVMLYICFKELIPSANKFCNVTTSLFAHALGGLVLHLSSQLLEQFEH